MSANRETVGCNLRNNPFVTLNERQREIKKKRFKYEIYRLKNDQQNWAVSEPKLSFWEFNSYLITYRVIVLFWLTVFFLFFFFSFLLSTQLVNVSQHFTKDVELKREQLRPTSLSNFSFFFFFLNTKEILNFT